MSNSNMSEVMVDLLANVPKWAYGIAVGKEGFADMGMAIFHAVIEDPSLDDRIAKQVYTDTRIAAVALGIERNAPLKEQTDKSRDSQISKLANFPKLGAVARRNPAVTTAMDFAFTEANGKYTRLVKCAVAVKAVLLDDLQADETTLMAAVAEALEDGEAERASVAVAKLGKAWEKLAYGTDKVPSDHAGAFASLRVAYPQDHAHRVGEAIETVRACLEAIEKSENPLL